MKMVTNILIAILLSLFAFTKQSFAEEISQLPEGISSTATNIVANFEKKAESNITDCIKDSSQLQKIYEYENVRETFNSKFNASSKCDSIIKELESINETRKSIANATSSEMCLNPTQDSAAEQKRKILEDIYNKSSQEYARFFAYDETLAKFEDCFSHYNNASTLQVIAVEEEVKKSSIRAKRKILGMHDLLGFYGENKGATGSDISSLISDIENKNITLKEGKSYAVIEEVREKWELSGAIIGYTIYSFEGKYIALPFVKGISYSCDTLPYTIFKLEKKIEIPEKEYTIYLLEPLE